MAGKAGLSKSLILKGMQCPKALYLQKNPPDFEIPEDPAREAKFKAGHEVGILAQQLFPGGTEVPFEGLSVPEQIKQTRQLIDSGAEVIYEASFEYDGIFVKVDILVRDGDAWQIHEVKMSTSVKEVNLNDVAIQFYVLGQAGLLISAAYLVHINNQYVRQGEVDVQQLFSSQDVLEEAVARQAGLPELIDGLRTDLLGGEPQIDIGPHCSDPYDCDFIPYCWQHIPENSIFDLRGNGVKKWGLYEQGIIRFDQIPLEMLNKNQRHQVEATLNQEDSIDNDAVAAFLDTLWYPLYHLDFETFNTAIPKFDGTRPYQQVPFQYSLHVQKTAGAEPEHHEFLAEPGDDPRRQLIEQLLDLIPENGCVLTYNQTFEKSVLRDFADLFPDLAFEIGKRLENVRDLMVPFRRRDVYRWQMRGSYSIKEVLPAMVPGLSYNGMAVADGMAAMQAYHDMCAMKPGEDLEQLRRAMLEYCQLDTLAMVLVLEKLSKVAS
ncbi:DUF2779 domain-containing protein [Geoalkalibacter halelectricus]|uniref:DUF2779 domain-containing protein n=1 Tax=Geoalkalibacter halelectricus TaxID=2847045 RepID=A0ABY5ZV39_9BACT|nr:DUF2779 domain-containing protein [Geoalkalibacter halelectricus]MDO3377711.1 DUF2779 domain-containing protein [Geoalkalibacter halelectricus]UWZ81499.1 DUF2779 domain-containing protein [Geoalkalibacter halelectricus]